MIREIEVFETSDGKRFDDRNKALDHATNSVRALLDKRLSTLQMEGRLSAVDRLRIVMAIVPDAGAARSLFVQLAPWVNY